MKASFSNQLSSKYGIQLLLTKTNQLNNNESRKTNSKKTVSCRLTKMETMKITTPTVDWISDLNITINS